jgi:hypothetical protein
MGHTVDQKTVAVQGSPYSLTPLIPLPVTVYILEAEKQEQINRASGEAQAMLAIADARAKGLELVARPLKTKVIIFTFADTMMSLVYA